jgi:hypothetical protein
VTAEEQRIFAGIYRVLKGIGEQVTMLGSVVSRAHGVKPFPAPRTTPLQPETPPMLHVRVPEQGELPLAGCVLAHKPRAWSNTVKVYEYLWRTFKRTQFTVEDLFDDRHEITKATGGAVKPSSFPRVLSALVKAGAATKGGFDNRRFVLLEPNDELREAVERVRNQKGGAK